MSNSLMWFRYDLRIKDNEALFEALKNQKCLLVFILDNGYLELETTSDFHLNFLNDSLIERTFIFKFSLNHLIANSL